MASDLPNVSFPNGDVLVIISVSINILNAISIFIIYGVIFLIFFIFYVPFCLIISYKLYWYLLKRTFFDNGYCYYFYGDFMYVKLFDENHENDLETSINEFLKGNNYGIIDIKYQVAIAMYGEDQVYCFSAMVIYEEK